MNVTGPFLDPRRKQSKKKWFLRYLVTERNPDGSNKTNAEGRPIKKKCRPYYKTREAAEADKPRIREQYAEAGAGAAGVLTRAQVEDYEQAKRAAPEATMLELAKFWRIHHPKHAAQTIAELAPKFLAWVETRLGKERHYSDLKSRLTLFSARFGTRFPATFTREEFLEYLLTLGKAGRTTLNQKRAIVNFFNWLVHEAKILEINPLAGIKKRALPKDIPKEIGFLSLVQANRYFRALEHYDPDLIAHEIIQLKAGVRADDEMADFDGKWVLPATREIVIPAAIAKTEKREVMDNLEENFWEWWKHYGREGILRPANYEQRWFRVRVLATIEDRAQADELARLPIKTLLARPESKAALEAWPWNARRRTFCTYHIAKHRSADSTALILRHRGEAETLHNSYRGLGVTQEQGVAFFSIMPNPLPASRVIYPRRPARGIIKLQLERAKLEAPPAAAVA